MNQPDYHSNARLVRISRNFQGNVSISMPTTIIGRGGGRQSGTWRCTIQAVFMQKKTSRANRLATPMSMLLFLATDCLSRQAFEQRSRKVALAEAAHDRDNRLALHLRPGRHLSRSPHVGSATDASHDAFFGRQFA